MTLGTRGRIITIALVAAIVIVSIAAYSWTKSSNDRDGDGVPDASDSSPDDPTVWRWGNATVILTVVNGLNRTVTFVALSTFDGVHSEVQWVNDTKTNESHTASFVVRWPMGPESVNLTILVSALPWQNEVSGLQEMLNTTIVRVEDGKETSVTVEYPEQFKSSAANSLTSEISCDSSRPGLTEAPEDTSWYPRL